MTDEPLTRYQLHRYLIETLALADALDLDFVAVRICGAIDQLGLGLGGVDKFEPVSGGSDMDHG